MARYDDTFVDRFLEPWNRHDVDGALALMTDDCVWEVTRGREGRPGVHRRPGSGRAPATKHEVEATLATPASGRQRRKSAENPPTCASRVTRQRAMTVVGHERQRSPFGLSGCFHHGLRPSLGPVGRTPMRRKRPFEWQWENPTSSGGRRDFVSRLFD
jgi:ketosteroid isomerase-like protein